MPRRPRNLPRADQGSPAVWLAEQYGRKTVEQQDLDFACHSFFAMVHSVIKCRACHCILFSPLSILDMFIFPPTSPFIEYCSSLISAVEKALLRPSCIASTSTKLQFSLLQIFVFFGTVQITASASLLV